MVLVHAHALSLSWWISLPTRPPPPHPTPHPTPHTGHRPPSIPPRNADRWCAVVKQTPQHSAHAVVIPLVCITPHVSHHICPVPRHTRTCVVFTRFRIMRVSASAWCVMISTYACAVCTFQRLPQAQQSWRTCCASVRRMHMLVVHVKVKVRRNSTCNKPREAVSVRSKDREAEWVHLITAMYSPHTGHQVQQPAAVGDEGVGRGWDLPQHNPYMADKWLSRVVLTFPSAYDAGSLSASWCRAYPSLVRLCSDRRYGT